MSEIATVRVVVTRADGHVTTSTYAADENSDLASERFVDPLTGSLSSRVDLTFTGLALREQEVYIPPRP